MLFTVQKGSNNLYVFGFCRLQFRKGYNNLYVIGFSLRMVILYHSLGTNSNFVPTYQTDR